MRIDRTLLGSLVGSTIARGRGHHLDVACRAGAACRPRPAAPAAGDQTRAAARLRSRTPGGRSWRWPTRTPGCRPTTSAATSTPATRSALHLADQHRRLPVEHRRRPRHRADRHAPRRAQRMTQTIDTVAGAGAARASGHVLQLVRPGDRREAHRPGRRTATRSSRSCPASTTAGWPPGCWSPRRAEPTAAPTQADAIREDDGLRLLLQPGARTRRAARSAAASGTSRPAGRAAVTGNYCGDGRRRLVHRPPLRRLQHRAADRVATSASPPARSRSKHYFGTLPHLPADNCDWSLDRDQADRRVARPTSAIDVFEGALPYRGMKLVPTWGGSMFEALMVPLFVPEETGARGRGASTTRSTCGPRSSTAWTRPATATGASRPSNNPAGGYREYGVDALGMDGAGYTSDQERTDWRPGLRGLPRPRGQPAPTTYGDGVVTPHASFLALRYAPERGAGEPARSCASDFDAYGPGGFYDAVAVRSGTVSQRYLVPRPGHGHGRARQRARRRRHAPLRLPGRAWSTSCGR